MSKKANPTTIGIFILLGLLLAVGGTILFSSAKFFSKRQRFILYFDASLKGLNPGAPVKFRGVTIGSVVEVRIRLNQAEQDLAMPVIIEVDSKMLQDKTDSEVNLTDQTRLENIINHGFRGQLEAQSLVTGLLYVELDFVHDAPEPVYHQIKKLYPEIPTAPTNIQELMANIAAMDLKGITEKLNNVLSRLDAGLGQLHIKDISSQTTNLLASLNHLATTPDLTNTLASAHKTLEQIRLLSQDLRSKLGPLADDANQTIRQASATLTETREGVQDLRDMIAPQAPLRRELLEAIDNLGRAAQSLSALAEFLNRNPNALLSGRKQPDQSP